MQILRHLPEAHEGAAAATRGAVLVLGNFACVHRGHRALLAQAKAIAEERAAPLAVMVFEPHPQEFFRPDSGPLRLESFRARAEEFAKLGVDILLVVHFDATLANMSAQDFVLDILVGRLGVSHVVVGKDFRFGKARSGDATVLSYMGEMEGFGITAYEPVAAAGEEKISSSAIRAALKAGKPEDAARLLGHWWSVDGHVAHGDKRGRAIGFPTANLKLTDMFPPAFGVYAVRAILDDGSKHDAVANFGMRPTVGGTAPQLEVHLFDFDGDLYGKLITVEFIAYLRPEQKFDGLDALKAQIAKDSAAAKAMLAETS
jgi:riboflavin kinase/FMN adenylyltransferase